RLIGAERLNLLQVNRDLAGDVALQRKLPVGDADHFAGQPVAVFKNNLIAVNRITAKQRCTQSDRGQPSRAPLHAHSTSMSPPLVPTFDFQSSMETVGPIIP